MAVMNQLDARHVETQLTAWLRRTYPGGPAAVTDVSIPHGNGGSAETVFLTAHWSDPGAPCPGADGERLVARVMPQGPAAFPPEHYNAEAQFRVLDALSRQPGLAVPPVRWLERDPSVIGSAFMVMPFVAGRIPGDDPPFTTGGWVLDLSADQVALLHDNGLAAVARLHATEWESLDLEPSLQMPGPGAAGLDQILGFYHRYLDWGRGELPTRTLDAAFEWLRANRPPEPERLTLCWGDSRLGNMIFADDLSVAAILDLETATLAAPEYDLAWWFTLNRHHSSGIGAPLPPGFPSETQSLERYEQLTGHRPEHMHYYQVLSCLRLSIMMVRIADLMQRRGLLPAGNTMAINNPASQMLAAALGLPPPDGSVTNFLGSLTS